LSTSDDYKNAKANIENTISNLQKGKSAKSSSQKSLNNLHNLQNELSMLQKEFQNETVSEMATKLAKIIVTSLVYGLASALTQRI